jgi:glycosyltransferase involved in cell wall biosynthesis
MTLEEQETGGLFRYSIVIVDNDRSESARQTVESFGRQSNISIGYYVEPEQNIALARNKAVENAKGDFVAFIDDDEFPNEGWLLSLYKAFHEFRADGVLGPVKPLFEVEPPSWITRGRLCERESLQTGTIIRDSKYTRTGNVLLSRRLFHDEETPFDPRFGKTGGEDGHFFRKMIRKGYVFVWCNEAYVSETVPPERLKRSYFLKRALLQGSALANSEKVSFFSSGGLKSLAALILYTPCLPGLWLLRHDLFMRYLIKECYHLGKLLSVCRLEVIKGRSV